MFIILTKKSVQGRNKKSPNELLFIRTLLLKGGGYLLSRIALQYHRRKWA